MSSSPSHGSLHAFPKLGGAAVLVFVAMLAGFVVESELTQFVQTTLEYRHPFFLFWIVHSSFAIIFPLHIVYLNVYKKYSLSALREGLSFAITNHLGPPDSLSFPWSQFLRLIMFMTIGITLPGAMWFAAISLASVGDVTAIWNTNAFFAYLITVKLFRMKFETRKLLAVVMATSGVILVVYGGSSSQSEADGSDKVETKLLGKKPTAPVLGDLLTLVASFGYGAYQALYKKFAALPDDPEVLADRPYEPLDRGEDEEEEEQGRSASPSGKAYPPPFGLHPNLMTAAVGIATFFTCWIPLPFLHYFDIEPFALPHSWKVVGTIAGISLSGVVFNSALMILLAEWGAIITSVGNLLTIILVMLSDIFFGAGWDAVTFWSILGSSVISVSFGVLAWDMAHKAGQ